MQRNLLVIRRNLKTAVCYFSGVAKKGAEEAARPGCHHFGVTPFYGTNRTKSNNMFNIGNVQHTEMD